MLFRYCEKVFALLSPPCTTFGDVLWYRCPIQLFVRVCFFLGRARVLPSLLVLAVVQIEQFLLTDDGMPRPRQVPCISLITHRAVAIAREWCGHFDLPRSCLISQSSFQKAHTAHLRKTLWMAVARLRKCALGDPEYGSERTEPVPCGCM